MLKLVILALIFYVVCSTVLGSNDRKDEKRWPNLMRLERNCLEMEKKCKLAEAKREAKKLAATMRKLREKARKNEKVAIILDLQEAAAEQAYIENRPLREAADMARTMADMGYKIDNLEREIRHRY